MNSFKNYIAERINIDGFSKSDILDLITQPDDSTLGDLCLPCFKFSKALRQPPAKIAETLQQKFDCGDMFVKVQSVNGYLNFFVNNSLFIKTALLGINQNYGGSNEGNGQVVCIDFSSINLAKELHIGHLGTTVIGAALCRLYRKLGYTVVGINHLGDYGTQFGKLIVAYKLWGDKQLVEQRGITYLEELYVKFHKQCVDKPELNDEAREWFLKIEQGDSEAVGFLDWFRTVTLASVEPLYKMLNVSFDSYKGESFFTDKMQPILDELQQKGILIESQGAYIVDLEQHGLPPCMLIRSDGASLYATRDIAAAQYRYDTYNFTQCLYVVAYQQNLHFKQVFKVLELMGRQWADRLVHVAYGMVSLEEGPMSSRKGNVVLLKDLLAAATAKSKEIISAKNPSLENIDSVAQDIGVGAVIFSALCNNRIKDNVFSFDKVLNFDGETSPYIQYSIARCNSVLEKGGGITPSLSDTAPLDNLESLQLIKLLNRYPETLRDAAHKYEPCILSRLLVDIAAAYNKFYFEHRIVTDDATATAARLYLTNLTRQVLTDGLTILGINSPKTM